jgi:hypothetical protein
MDNARKVEIIDERIARCQELVNNFIFFGISFKKLAKVQNELSRLQAVRAGM